MDIQKIATYGTAAAVVGTGSIVGGNVAIDNGKPCSILNLGSESVTKVTSIACLPRRWNKSCLLINWVLTLPGK